jgi:hypothetical protein
MYSMESMLLPGVWHDMNASGMVFMCIKRNMVVGAKVRKLREIFFYMVPHAFTWCHMLLHGATK